MNEHGYNYTIEECVKSLRYDCEEITGIESYCLIKVYYNLKTYKYRALSDLYYFNRETKEKVIFESANCNYEEEAINNLFLMYNTFYKNNGPQIFDEDASVWVGRRLPSFRF